MSDEVISNVDMDLSNRSPMRPQFNNVAVTCTLGEVHFEDKEGKPVPAIEQAENLIVPLVFEQEAASTPETGSRMVPPGYKYIDRIGVKVTGGRTKERILDALVQLQCAALNLPKGKFFEPSELNGRRVLARFETRLDRNDPSKTYQDVKRYMAVK